MSLGLSRTHQCVCILSVQTGHVKENIFPTHHPVHTDTRQGECVTLPTNHMACQGNLPSNTWHIKEMSQPTHSTSGIRHSPSPHRTRQGECLPMLPQTSTGGTGLNLNKANLAYYNAILGRGLPKKDSFTREIFKIESRNMYVERFICSKTNWS